MARVRCGGRGNPDGAWYNLSSSSNLPRAMDREDAECSDMLYIKGIFITNVDYHHIKSAVEKVEGVMC